jgi:hypothetical protein
MNNRNDTTKTHAGQDARIVKAMTTSRGRVLYALKTCATKPVATAWDDDGPLRRLAANLLLNLA